MGFMVLKIVGFLAIAAGLIMAFSPTLLGLSSSQLDAYASIESRVKWGFLIGLGAFLVTQNHLIPWSVTLPGLFFWLTAGIVVARSIGIMLCGLAGKQWLWLLTEVMVLVVFGFWFLVLQIKHITRRSRAIP
ncbi:hypothetical protein M1D72_05660 [Vibrio sp. AK197]